MNLPPRAKNHLPWLDWIRFLAAFTVLLVHARHSTFVDFGMLPAEQRTMPVAALYAASRVADEAVILFFVLSGFLVGGVAIDRIKAGTFKVADYAVDRFARIMLPLIPALLLTAIISGVVDGGFDILTFIGNLLSLQGALAPGFGGNAPLWSLAYEVWFYVLAGALGIVILHKDKLWFGIILLMLFAAVFTQLSVVYFFCWALGALAFVYRPARFSIYSMAASVLLMLPAIMFIEFSRQTHSLEVNGWRAHLPAVEVSRLVLAGGMALLLRQASRLSPRNGFMLRFEALGATLAAFAYTLYLTHYPLLRLAEYCGIHRAQSITNGAVAIFMFEMLACMLIAWGIYLMFEKHTAEVRIWIKARLLTARRAPEVA